MRISLPTGAIAACLIVSPMPAVADPPATLSNVPAHRHFIVTPNGNVVEVGPDVCDDPNLQDAFNQFHYNVHHNFGTTPTNGPQAGAPGLHDGEGAELAAGSCPPS